MKKLSIVLLILGMVATTGCSRRPPEKFQTDKPSIKTPETSPVASPTALNEFLTINSDAVPMGHWELTIDRQIFMRSTTMATTEVSSKTWLSFISGSDTTATGSTRITVQNARSTIKTAENGSKMERVVVDMYQGLRFVISRLPEGDFYLKAEDERTIPDGLTDAIGLLIPTLPGGPGTFNGKPVEWSRQFSLPGKGNTLEKLHSTAGITGISKGLTILTHDYSGIISGSTIINGVKGTVTGGERLGRCVSRFDRDGLAQSEMSDSRTWSVTLTPPKGKKKLLEQKVTLKATLTRSHIDDGKPL